MMRTGRVGWTALAVWSCIAVTAAAAPPQDPAPPAPAQADQGSPALEDDKDKSSYAVGMNLGGALRRQSTELDVDLIVRGFRDALAGEKTLLSPVEMRAILSRLQSELKAKQAALLGEKAAKAKADSEAFLSANKAKEGVTTLESGLQYRILKSGDGRKPTVDDTVVCHYRGTLIDGTEFDSSYKRAQPATLTVRKLVKGWTEALQLMPVGSKWQIFIPASPRLRRARLRKRHRTQRRADLRRRAARHPGCIRACRLYRHGRRRRRTARAGLGTGAGTRRDQRLLQGRSPHHQGAVHG